MRKISQDQNIIKFLTSPFVFQVNNRSISPQRNFHSFNQISTEETYNKVKEIKEARLTQKTRELQENTSKINHRLVILKQRRILFTKKLQNVNDSILLKGKNSVPYIFALYYFQKIIWSFFCLTRNSFEFTQQTTDFNNYLYIIQQTDYCDFLFNTFVNIFNMPINHKYFKDLKKLLN
ncbi:unnamed protein product [Paramecium octaurelia]|uniref:Uncharacterized protein n=1 Tax=Paramecium octaurelia TaxID=43137 RepID=A0A8S1YQY9_PAROT|nr:unnamed protein product [Paramecium octaurelia]